MRLNGEMCPLIFNGTLDKRMFAEYLKTCLKPTLSSNDVILLDNSSVHKSKLVIETLNKCKIKYLFLPRYSPDYNPIELFWASMKSFLKKQKARTHEKLENAVLNAINSVSVDNIGNWFSHCGYITN